jgi:hypothetical protein
VKITDEIEHSERLSSLSEMALSDTLDRSDFLSAAEDFEVYAKETEPEVPVKIATGLLKKVNSNGNGDGRKTLKKTLSLPIISLHDKAEPQKERSTMRKSVINGIKIRFKCLY